MGGARHRGTGSIGARRADGRIPVSIPRMSGSGKRRYGYVRHAREAPARLRELRRMEVETARDETFPPWINQFVETWAAARGDPVHRRWAVDQLLR